MVIDNEIKKKFKEYFGLDFEKYRNDGYSAVVNHDQVDSLKMYDYLVRKYKFTTSMIECIEKEYGKECREWWETTFLNKKKQKIKLYNFLLYSIVTLKQYHYV